MTKTELLEAIKNMPDDARVFLRVQYYQSGEKMESFSLVGSVGYDTLFDIDDNEEDGIILKSEELEL